MSIDINQINSNRPDAPKRHDSGQIKNNSVQNTENKQNNTTPTPNSIDSVSLSSAAQNLTKIEAELKSLPDIDQGKVDLIKARIDSGEYQVNPENMAQKMLNIEV